MSDEEKKAIENLKVIEEYAGDNYVPKFIRNNIKILIELIENQQKELKDLKDIQQQICNEELITQEYVKENFISKDKIKAKIEELKKDLKEELDALGYGVDIVLAITSLQSLLKEE